MIIAIAFTHRAASDTLADDEGADVVFNAFAPGWIQVIPSTWNANSKFKGSQANVSISNLKDETFGACVDSNNTDCICRLTSDRSTATESWDAWDPTTASSCTL